MKLKMIIAILLALVTLGTLAMPALAAAPLTGTLNPDAGYSGTGTVTLKEAHVQSGTTIKFTITVAGGPAIGSTNGYSVQLSWNGSSIINTEYVGPFYTDANGNGKFTGNSHFVFLRGGTATENVKVALVDATTINNTTPVEIFNCPSTFSFTFN